MADLSIVFAGIKAPNPFWLASAPPTDKAYNVVRAFEAGWGGVVWKTLGEDPAAVNKMDLVEFSQEVFDRISVEYREFARKLSVDTIHIVPVSALDGDNVVNPSDKLAWYEGETLLSLLESAEVERELERHPVRLPVQYVNRPNLDFRGFAGTLASGILR